MKFKNNPYYSPKKCGLEIFKSIDTAGDYEFDMFVIWRKLDDNTLWWDTDSGCSCPCPFDNQDNGHNLKPITEENWNGFINGLINHYNISKNKVNQTIREVKDYLKL
jgi:hypothetical protein